MSSSTPYQFKPITQFQLENQRIDIIFCQNDDDDEITRHYSSDDDEENDSELSFIDANMAMRMLIESDEIASIESDEDYSFLQDYEDDLDDAFTPLPYAVVEFVKQEKQTVPASIVTCQYDYSLEINQSECDEGLDSVSTEKCRTEYSSPICCVSELQQYRC
jgi:hypothetical protein